MLQAQQDRRVLREPQVLQVQLVQLAYKVTPVQLVQQAHKVILVLQELQVQQVLEALQVRQELKGIQVQVPLVQQAHAALVEQVQQVHKVIREPQVPLVQ